MHFGERRSYQLLDQTVEEFEAARALRQAKENK
jgi:hypothetical protein